MRSTCKNIQVFKTKNSKIIATINYQPKKEL